MKRRPIEKPVFLTQYAQRYAMSEAEAEARFERGEIAGKRIDGQLVLDDHPPDPYSAVRISRLSGKLILAGIAGYLVWLTYTDFLYPAFRDMAWRHNVTVALTKAGTLREIVARRLVEWPPGRPVNDGIAIESSGAITESWVAADGTIVVTVQLDYPYLHLDRPVTVIAVPRLDSMTGTVAWLCGTDTAQSRRWLPATCREPLALPASP